MIAGEGDPTPSCYPGKTCGDHDKVRQLDRLVAKKMGFEDVYPVTGQTYTRKIDSQVLDVLCDRFCLSCSHMSVSSWPVAVTVPRHKKGGSENPPFQRLHLRLRTRANSCTVARPKGPGEAAAAPPVRAR